MHRHQLKIFVLMCIFLLICACVYTHTHINYNVYINVNKVMLAIFWGMKGPIINVLEKGSTVNSASYCQILRQT